jgi:hypothetical protein
MLLKKYRYEILRVVVFNVLLVVFIAPPLFQARLIAYTQNWSIMFLYIHWMFGSTFCAVKLYKFFEKKIDQFSKKVESG